MGSLAEHGATTDHHVCGVCNCLFNSPRTLACGHTFCTSCLVQWLFRDERVSSRSCPICRQICRSFPAVNVVTNAHCESLALRYSAEVRASRADKKRNAVETLEKHVDGDGVARSIVAAMSRPPAPVAEPRVVARVLTPPPPEASGEELHRYRCEVVRDRFRESPSSLREAVFEELTRSRFCNQPRLTAVFDQLQEPRVPSFRVTTIRRDADTRNGPVVMCARCDERVRLERDFVVARAREGSAPNSPFESFTHLACVLKSEPATLRGGSDVNIDHCALTARQLTYVRKRFREASSSSERARVVARTALAPWLVSSSDDNELNTRLQAFRACPA
ncbi:hypothetical protein CYMTET_4543 [Cymbomonas tetramitiformis]|uniref:RING-type domain-containing protein n=1 Tax=Cymbomonas tetramitiformis TaxID=36881 RepID=A0AAE0LKE6_9CHLO|nr:hypothetical protein CYMTET_4543 [Cymbomonas tetramitiformis]